MILGLWGMSSSWAVPEANYSSTFDIRKNQSQYRAQNGKLYQYKFNKYNEYKFDCIGVDSAAANDINDWWDTNSGYMIMPFVDSLSTLSTLSYTLGSVRRGFCFDNNNTLWAVTNSSELINITISGTLVQSYNLFSIDSSFYSPHAITYDKTLDTLWVSKISSGTKIYQLSKSATIISSIVPTTIDSSISQILGLAYDTSGNDHLWGVEPLQNKVYQFTKSGTLVGFLGTTNIISGASLPFGITYNPDNDTLWAINNTYNIAYNFTKSGSLIGFLNTNLIDSSMANTVTDIAYSQQRRTLWYIRGGQQKFVELPNIHAVKFTGQNAPFNKFQLPYYAAKYNGTIELAEDNP